MRRLSMFLAGCLLAAATTAFAAAPHLELAVTSTNLVVTERLGVTLKLWLPALEDELADTPPVIPARPPHVEADFLEETWRPESLAPLDPRRQPPIESRFRDRGASFFTLNAYVSDDIFGGMRDPFGMFGDDFFERAMGPQRQRFPFRRRQVSRDGVPGWEFFFEAGPYRAVKPGRAAIPPVRVKLPLITEVRRRRDRYGRAVNVPVLEEVVLRTAPVDIEVVEPPLQGRPASYCGVISSNFNVRAYLDANVCKSGDLLQLTLEASGVDDLAAIRPPRFAEAVDRGGAFRLDEASLKTETLSASRRFTWRVRAIKVGTAEFPSLDVSYFDLGSRSYVTRRTGTIPVQVKAGVQATLGALDETGDEAEIFPQPDGVDFDPRGRTGEPLLPHLALALGLFLAAPLVFLAIRLLPPVRRRLAARAEARRRDLAFARCRKGLRSPDGERRAAAVRRFFENRYGVNGAAVTAADVRRLMGADYSEEEVRMVEEALSDHDRTHYAARRTVVALVAVCLSLLGAAATPADFTCRRADALASRAADEKAFRAAAETYASCVEAGVANPVVYGNLGACALMGGDPRTAIAAFGCAERRGGETASTRRGMRAALARLRNDPREDLPLTRVFFRPHYLFSLDARLLFAAGAWTLCWLLALLPAGGLRRFLLGVCIVVAAASATSVAVSLAEEHFAEEAIHVRK